jgi:hypothetical protein
MIFFFVLLLQLLRLNGFPRYLTYTGERGISMKRGNLYMLLDEAEFINRIKNKLSVDDVIEITKVK